MKNPLYSEKSSKESRDKMKAIARAKKGGPSVTQCVETIHLEDVEFGSIFIWEKRRYLLPHQTYRVHPRYLDINSQELVTIPGNSEVEVIEGRVGVVIQMNQGHAC